MGYNSAGVKDICETCVYRGVNGDGPSNAANCIFPRPTPIAMATKFGIKLAITRLIKDICEIFASIKRFSWMGQ